MPPRLVRHGLRTKPASAKRRRLDRICPLQLPGGMMEIFLLDLWYSMAQATFMARQNLAVVRGQRATFFTAVTAESYSS